MDDSERRKRLIYRSWHRGTREMDLLLGSFADRHVPSFGAADLDLYEDMLDCSDPDLYDWMTGRAAPPDNPMVRRFMEHRFVMPDGQP